MYAGLNGLFVCGGIVLVYLFFVIGWPVLLSAVLCFWGYLFLLELAGANFKPDGSRRSKSTRRRRR